MNSFESAGVRACLRDVYRIIGFRSYRSLAVWLYEHGDRTFELVDAIKFAENQHVSDRTLAAILPFARRLLAANLQKIEAFYANSPCARGFLSGVAEDFGGAGAAAGGAPGVSLEPDSSIRQSGGNFNVIFSNWHLKSKRGGSVLMTGVYQLFRLHKPVPSMEESDPMKRAVISELIYLDSDKMECSLVTASGRVYFGTMFITHEYVLYGLLQRPDETGAEIHQRFFCQKLDGKKLPMYSGLMTKIGQTTRRPLSSECLYVPVPRNHDELYTEMMKYHRKAWSALRVEKTSIIMDYIMDLPPLAPPGPEWSRVRFVKDFPALTAMVNPKNHEQPLLLPPSRTLDQITIMKIASNVRLAVFRHSRRNTDIEPKFVDNA